MMSDTATTIPHFRDNFWESSEANGITTLIERMRGAKQTCERYKHAYEARVLLEEEYGKTLLQIAQKQKASSLENGSSRSAMDTMLQEFMSVAQSHLYLSELLRDKVATPLGALLNKQKIVRKEAQTSIQKLYHTRQSKVQLVRKAHKRHNLEIEKADLLVQQQTTESEKHDTFERARITIVDLKKAYDEALEDLKEFVKVWNIKWEKTCDSFEQLELERLEFFKLNLSNCANLMIGCLEKEVQAYERVSTESEKIDPVQDLVEFVNINKSSAIIPSPVEYIKLHAYHEANHGRGDLKHVHNVVPKNIDTDYHSESEDRAHLPHRRRKSSVSSMASEGTSNINKSSLLMRAAAAEDKIANLKQIVKPSPAIELSSTKPVLMMGVMEVYPSDEEDDEAECEYVTETESEEEEEKEEEEHVEVIKAIRQNEHSSKVHEKCILPQNDQEAAYPKVTEVVQRPIKAEPTHSKSNQDDKVDRLNSAYQEIKKDRNTPPSSLLAKQPFSRQRRVSFADHTGSPIDIFQADSSRIVDPSNTLNKMNVNNNNVIPRYAQSPGIQDAQPQEDADDGEEDYEGTSESAALELDDMLRELDTKRIIRNGEENTRYNRHPDINPTASTSSPSLMQQQQQQRKNIPSQYYQQPPHQASRRMSSIEPSNQSGSIRSDNSSGHTGLYDPFNSLSSKKSSMISSEGGSMESNVSTSIPPSAQSMHKRMLKNTQTNYHGSVSSVSSSGGSVRSIGQQAYNNDKFARDYGSVGSKTSTKMDENEDHFIDFAYALYDYAATEDGEIGFSEGDLLGIKSKNEDGEQGWWVASLLNSKNQIVRTGVVPSNFLECVSNKRHE